jgi:hypothetical protein
MKRSKLFLGISSGLLMLAGFAAAKTNFGALLPFYYTAQGNVYQGICKFDNNPFSPFTYNTLTTGNPPRLTTLYGSVSRKLYTSSNCILPAYFGFDK